MTIQVDDIRKQFPFFRSNRNLIYFDNAATTQKPQSVIDSYINFYSNFKTILTQRKDKLSILQ